MVSNIPADFYREFPSRIWIPNLPQKVKFSTQLSLIIQVAIFQISFYNSNFPQISNQKESRQTKFMQCSPSFHKTLLRVAQSSQFHEYCNPWAKFQAKSAFLNFDFKDTNSFSGFSPITLSGFHSALFIWWHAFHDKQNPRLI